MIAIDGYTIEQYPEQNKIVVTLPQTMGTITSTVGTVSDRKRELSGNDLIAVLIMVKAMMEVEHGDISG